MTSIGRRGYLADYFRATNPPCSSIVGTTDRHSIDREYTVGLSSCDRSYLVPSVESENYIDVILDICVRERIDFVFSLLDIDNYILSKHISKFEAIGVIPFISSYEVNQICLDKYRTYTFLRENGLSTPETYISASDFDAAGSAFPAIVKPREGCASEGLLAVRNKEQLKSFFNPDIHIIQELLAGDEYSLDIFNDLDGRMLSYVAKKKIRMRAGETDQAVTISNQRLGTVARQISSTLGHVGPLDVDLLVLGQEMAIIDFNPRFGGGYPLSHAAGADFPQLMVDIAAGRESIMPKSQYRENLVMLKDTSPRVFTLDELGGLVSRHDI